MQSSPPPNAAGPLPAFQLSGRHDIDDPIPGIDDAARFHEGWEARIFALMRTAVADGLITTDEFRHTVERLPAESYHGMTYFERWLHAVQQLCLEKGHISAADLAAGHARAAAHAHAHPSPAAASFAPRPEAGVQVPPVEERFAVGARVRLEDGPGAHHRMPAWARGLTGVVTCVRGHFPLPDLVVDRRGAAGMHWRYALYSVQVPATDAFEDADPRDVLALDAYDPYLQEAAR
ncbi:hypothetical protein GCM10018793_42010 [Streptomyces sulfonofaciens]|uniref:nitrile hydratase n=1 Tax=Streptomyces sulfonofaciens TaxID=68272 RepID=A0A919L3S1_9ACTN|nr:SH3-like domain-containing protein [Streptomyces sulfonofaciens]GHH82359.1 hypothetical protein GCM10018793_42010 [Streptomyces sulfonofaciens]